MSGMQWRNMGKRTKLGIFDGSVLGPIVLCLVAFNVTTIVILLVYAACSAYLTSKGISMIYLVRRIRFWMRDGTVLARSANFWRQLIG